VRLKPTPLLILCAVAAACAGRSSEIRSESSDSPGPAPTAEILQASFTVRGPSPERQKVVNLARALLGVQRIALNGKRYSNDCSGFVRAVFDYSRIDLMSDGRPGDSGTQAIYRYALRHGEVYRNRHPQPGDLVFFRDTYDKHRDGRRNNGLTHVGIVDSIDPDGTVSVIHRVRRGVVRYRMNLSRPHLHLDPANGQMLNDYLRIAGKQTKPALTGELFAIYGTVLGPQLKTVNR
jgi:peptidoglycan DL-endopeptidase CwlO